MQRINPTSQTPAGLAQPAQGTVPTSSSSSAHRQNPSSSSSSSLPTGPLNARPVWRDWDDLAVRVSRLPELTTTRHLADCFKRYGNIVFIELVEPHRNSAIIRFSPPPHAAFWTQKVLMATGDGRTPRVDVRLLVRRTPERVLAPGGQSHSARLNMTPTSIQFGVMSSPNEFMAMNTVARVGSHFSFLVDLKWRKIEITFALVKADPRLGQTLTVYKVRISFSYFANLVALGEGEPTFSLLLPLPSPPTFFRRVDDTKTTHSAHQAVWKDWDMWNRVVDVAAPPRNAKVHKLMFKKSDLAAWGNIKRALLDFNISIHDLPTAQIRTVPKRDSGFWDLFEPKTDDLLVLPATDEIHLPFDVRYQLEVCISQGYFDEVNLGPDFLRKLTEMSNAAHKGGRNRAKDILTYVAGSRGPGASGHQGLYPKRYYNPMALFQDRKALSYYAELGAPSHCAWLRKVVVTPSTMYLSTPIPEPSNRVLRRYAAYADRFLRVQFTDELVEGKLHPSPVGEQKNALFNRVYRTLANGIVVGGRHFEFLAFGNSQFRENGAYFFAPTPHLSCDEIRAWMGDVSHIRVVAKYAARLGQCFSTTRTLNSPISFQIEQMDDMERNGWCFTDGVGKISAELLHHVASPVQVRKTPPSAVQFRLGGNKGILVVWPDIAFNRVGIRPSQQKFKALSTNLEIIRSSGFSVATLNRQTITILSSLGVPDEAFLSMQREQLKDYDKAISDSATAMRLLSRFVDQNGITTTMAQMIADGFMLVREPFFMRVLHVWRLWSLRLLRDKARIVVEKGAFVLGCVDETRTLRGYEEGRKEYPQIFLQVPRPGGLPGASPEYMVVEGLCVVGRNPSLHPGDIRVVEAVDNPGLRHLRDVVVFPATGDRDIPSMCSGGDLDGDDFFVMWDRRLIPTEHNHPPMIHEPEKPTVLPRDVKVNDLISFFVTYMKNDSLSSIAIAHLVQADQLEGGPKHPICIELARLHSDAVDYPKSGKAAHLRDKLRPRQNPHFMEKPGRSYHSKTVLGQLFDVVSKRETRAGYDGKMVFDERIMRRFALPDDVLTKARIIKRQHDRALRQIMNQWEIGTEFEVWSTFIVDKPRSGSDYRMQETMGPVITNHRERFRNACIRVAGSRDPVVLYPFIAAAYRVTWEAVEVARLHNEQEPLISFPWIFERNLGQIATSQVDYQLDAWPEITAGAFETEEDGDTQYEELVGLGVMDPTLMGMELESEPELVLHETETKTETETEDGATSAPNDVTQPQEEQVELEEEEENPMDELERLMIE